MKPLYKKGDLVKIKSQLDRGKNPEDYRYWFFPQAMIKYSGGPILRVTHVQEAEFEIGSTPDDGYQYTLADNGHNYRWCSSMFEEEF